MTPQTVTVTGVYDKATYSGDHTATMSHTVSGYGNITTADSVEVIVLDEDDPRSKLVLTPSTILETGGASTVTVTLDELLPSPFTVAISPHAVAPATNEDYVPSQNNLLQMQAYVFTIDGLVTITAVNRPDVKADKTVMVTGHIATEGVNDPLPVELTIQNVSPPTITSSWGSANPTGGTAFYVRLTFSEGVTGLAPDDFIVENGRATYISSADGGRFYDVSFQATGQAVKYRVRTGAVVNADGTAANAESPEGAHTFDFTPTLAIQGPDEVFGAFSVNFAFSEPVAEFGTADITVTNGTQSNFTTIDDATYSVLITPTTAGEVVVSVAAGAGKDLDGTADLTLAASKTAQPVVISPTELSVTEAAGDNHSATYTVTLNEKITEGAVTVLHQASFQGYFTISTAGSSPQLVFDKDNWSMPQTVTVTGADNEQDGDKAATIDHTVTGPHRRYRCVGQGEPPQRRTAQADPCVDPGQHQRGRRRQHRDGNPARGPGKQPHFADGLLRPGCPRTPPSAPP